MGIIFIYITCASSKEAEKISAHLFRKRLIACSNYFPIQSIYRWKGKIEKSKEFTLILKTLDKNYPAIKKEVEKLHSYSVPCITRIPVEPNEKYAKWMKKELSS